MFLESLNNYEEHCLPISFHYTLSHPSSVLLNMPCLFSICKSSECCDLGFYLKVKHCCMSTWNIPLIHLGCWRTQVHWAEDNKKLNKDVLIIFFQWDVPLVKKTPFFKSQLEFWISIRKLVLFMNQSGKLIGKGQQLTKVFKKHFYELKW